MLMISAFDSTKRTKRFDFITLGPQGQISYNVMLLLYQERRNVCFY